MGFNSAFKGLISELEVGGWLTARHGHFIPGKDTVPIVQEAGWAPGPFWEGKENIATTGNDPRTVRLVASRYTE